MDVREFLKENIVYLDGGMGTLLQKKDLCPENILRSGTLLIRILS